MTFTLFGCGKRTQNKTISLELELAEAVPAAGPYTTKTYRDGVDDCWAVLDRHGKVIASYEFWDDYNGKSEQIEANFWLLAMAPELLISLESLFDACASFPYSFFNGQFFKAMNRCEIFLTKTFGNGKVGKLQFESWKNSHRDLKS